MKKTTLSLKLKNVPKSQPSISAFFAKKALPMSVQHSTNVRESSEKNDKMASSQIKLKDIKETDKHNCNSEIKNGTEQNMATKKKIPIECKNIDKNTITGMKLVDNYGRKNCSKQNGCNINKRTSNLLLKGKYHDCDDQKVPDVVVSPSKKIKLSINKNSEKEDVNIQNDESVKYRCNKDNGSVKVHENRKSLINYKDKTNGKLDIHGSVLKSTISIQNAPVQKDDNFKGLKDDNFKGLKDDNFKGLKDDNFKGLKDDNFKENNLVESELTSLHNEVFTEISNNIDFKFEKNSVKQLSPKLQNFLKDSNCSGDTRGNAKTIEKHVKENVSCKIDLKTEQKDDLEYLYGDDWDLSEVENIDKEQLDLTKWTRCKVVSVFTSDCRSKKILQLKSSSEGKVARCVLEGQWVEAMIAEGDIISIVGSRSVGCEDFSVSNEHGFVVTQPDTLVSGTAVVGSLFCRRRAVLQDRFRGVDPANKAMVIGSLVHELFQIALSKEINDYRIEMECRTMMERLNVFYMLYNADMTQEEGTTEIMKYAPQITTFVSKYVKKNGRGAVSNKKKEWEGSIEEIVDIEESIWAPHIGVKGKIDVTLEVKIHDRKTKSGNKRLMPLELKTGRASVSAEHRGQVMLYTMMMEELPGPHIPHNTGLLLYLKDSINLHEVSTGHSEKRDLIMLRNELAHYLASWGQKRERPNQKVKPSPCAVANESPPEAVEDLDGLEELFLEEMREGQVKRSEIPVMELPEPINHHSACGKCPYLTLCSIHLKDGTLSAGHPLQRLQQDAVGHLTPSHREYLLYWTGLLALEESDRAVFTPLRDIWTISPEEREKRGKCVANLSLNKDVSAVGDRFQHSFFKRNNDNEKDSVDLQRSMLQIGDYVLVSTEDRISVAAGTITDILLDNVTVLLERNLSKRYSLSMKYHLDLYESQSLVVHNLTNLGLLMDNADVANKLRSIVIDKQLGVFESKLPRSVINVGEEYLKKLNPLQQRAILKALAAKDYLLIRGLPGTGKTQTIVALVEILCRLGKDVLITSQTHSAVDNIFMRLKDSNLKMLRLGSASRIHKDLLHISEVFLSKQHPGDLVQLYQQAKVVGVTCLGSHHALLTKRSFDVCIVDESTQVLQCSILRPLFAAKKFVLVGDPDQLPPIVRSNKARQLGLDESLFKRLNNEECTVSLSVQYRMNGPIMALANFLTYQGQLKPANEHVENATINCDIKNVKIPMSPWLDKCVSNALSDSVILMDTGSTSHLNLKKMEPCHSDNTNKKEYFNVYEAALVDTIINIFLELGVPCSEIGCIAPYRDQVMYLRENAAPGRDVEINTVDQFQGRDKSIIVFSCTKTRTQSENDTIKSTENEILEDHRRLTVAATRAKHKLIIVGDVSTLKHYTPFKILFDGVNQKNPLRSDTLDTIGCTVSLQDLICKKQFNWEEVMNNFNKKNFSNKG